MNQITTHKRVKRMYAHQQTDRIPITDSQWGATVERWQREGMPAEANALYSLLPLVKKHCSEQLLAANYKTWRQRGDWISAELWLGFDVTHSWAVGTERIWLFTRSTSLYRPTAR